MYGISAFSSLRKSLFTKLKPIAIYFKYVKWNSYVAKHPTSFELKHRVSNDIVLFSFENPKFFIYLNVISASHCAIWTYVGAVLFRALEKNSAVDTKPDGVPQIINYIEQKYGKSICLVVIILGWAVFLSSCFYSFRSIRKIILHQGGRNITIFTYSFPGYDKIEAPLRNVTVVQHRKKAKKFIALKVKNIFSYFLLDVKGNFSDPTLFDFTIGVKRGF